MVENCTGVGWYCKYGAGLYRGGGGEVDGQPKVIKPPLCFLLLGHHRPFCCVFAIIRICICPFYSMRSPIFHSHLLSIFGFWLLFQVLVPVEHYVALAVELAMVLVTSFSTIQTNLSMLVQKDGHEIDKLSIWRTIRFGNTETERPPTSTLPGVGLMFGLSKQMWYHLSDLICRPGVNFISFVDSASEEAFKD